ncbi:uncharacterized protein LOC133440726 [Cololabis saira]|uniref:uncharacterized protein LOC133440726 n=1 Tax=Cololabis saira TaxID=129043 RepID=UPI002AD34C21|nr:uncharacterized protein LOC133440726 [Cololabis saira]
MEEELQELRELIAQLRTDNDRLRQEQVMAVPGPSIAPPVSPPPAAPPAVSAPPTERLIFVPRDRRCPTFRGKSGIGLAEWLEEVQACMRARHLSTSDQAFFLFDHLEGEAREEIKYRPSEERSDPAKIIEALQELYGCAESYVALQEAFFSRRQHEGETLLEFSLALMSLMTSVKQRAPSGIPNAEVLLRDQFVEHVLDGSLRRELKQFVRRQPTSTLLEARGEAIRWEREGLPGGVRGRSHSVPSVFGAQCVVQGSRQVSVGPPQSSELQEMREMLKLQQEQLNQLTQSISRLQGSQQPNRTAFRGPIICRRCQQSGHIARECDGVRASARTQPPSSASQPSRPPHSAQLPGN